MSPNDTAFQQSDQHPSKICKFYQHYPPYPLPTLSKVPNVSLFFVLPTLVSRRCVHQGRMLDQVIVHVFWTTTLTQHSTPTQANNRKQQQHPKTHHTTQSKHHKQKAYPYYINGITYKQLAYTKELDIIIIQETKLTTISKTKITNYTPIRTDRVVKLGGGLLTYIRHNIIDIQKHINTHTTQNYSWSESTQTGTNTLP